MIYIAIILTLILIQDLLFKAYVIAEDSDRKLLRQAKAMQEAEALAEAWQEVEWSPSKPQPKKRKSKK